MEGSKSVLRSKTLWFNVATGIVALLAGVLSALREGAEQVADGTFDLPDGWGIYATLFVAVGNAILRFLTKQGVHVVSPKPPTPNKFNIFPPPPMAALLACLLLPAAIAGAAPPELKVTATEPTSPGQRLIVDCTETVADRIEFLVWADGLPDGDAGLEQFAALIDELRKRGAEVIAPAAPQGDGYVSKFGFQGDRIDLLVFDSTPGAHYRIGIVAFTGDRPDDAGGCESLLIERRIPGSSPTPPQPPAPPGPGPEPPPTPPGPPGPGPEPPPTPPGPPSPDIPDGKFGVGKRIHEWAQAVNSSDRAAESRRIARVLEDVAGRIKSGSVAGNDGIREALLNGLSQALDSNATANWSAFGELLAKLIVELLLGGKLSTPADWVAFLIEVAQALLVVN